MADTHALGACAQKAWRFESSLPHHLKMKKELIRNFSIIAHIDHGKSTLADRLIDITLGSSVRGNSEQLLDTMDLEKERGITIKAQAIRLNYLGSDKKEYQLNLIDTPGHVDFSYEVSRALAACEGALLLVDGTQGIQAQTLANIYLALEQGVHIIPVVNKIDSNLANPEAVSLEIQNTFGFKEEEILFVSAKTGEGVEALLEAVVKDIPSPKGETSESLQALIFDSKYDSFKGVLAYVRVKNGIIKVGEKLHLMGTGKDCEVLETGTFNPNLMKKDFLNTGEVGYIATGLKNVRDCRVGDTLTTTLNPAGNSLSGYESLKSMVFSGLYPVDGEQYPNLRDSLGKLQLNDASLVFEPETSGALGFGFRCGFLGLLHMDIVQERLEREYNIELIGTAPTVKYTVELDNKSSIEVDNPSKWPEKQKINQVFEPWIRLSIISPSEYIGPITELVTSHRGEFLNTEWIQSNSVGSQLSGSRVLMEFNIPLSEILVDFHGKLKSCSKGYASMDYSQISPRPSDLVKLQILINEQKVDSLSVITHRSRSVYMARDLVKQLKELIPRQMFDIPLQGGIGGKIIARETIKALRKNVTAKCYGGDITRKRKLLAKQAEGKKRMKKVGSVEVPQEAFMSILRSDHQE